VDLKRILREASTGISDEGIAKYVPFLLELMPKYEINTPLRQRHFLAQVLHESGGFRFVRENLNYSTDGLLKTFPRYFHRGLAEEYARKPQKIASRVYANRMGNGDEESGDGWLYIGRGLIQITGRINYLMVSQALFGDARLLGEPTLLEEPQYAVESACYFWQEHSLNTLADKDDIVAVTRRINGGINGLDDRIKYYHNLNLC